MTLIFLYLVYSVHLVSISAGVSCSNQSLIESKFLLNFLDLICANYELVQKYHAPSPATPFTVYSGARPSAGLRA